MAYRSRPGARAATVEPAGPPPQRNRAPRRRPAAPAAAAGAPAGAAAGRGGRGGGGAAPSTSEFYNYDTTAAAGAPIPDGPPTETHQKITVNGEALAYTARAGYLPLRNATTGQSEAHLFYTCYAKDGVSDASARPVLFFLGGAPGVAAAWQEFGGLGPKRMKWASDGTAGHAALRVGRQSQYAARRRPIWFS